MEETVQSYHPLGGTTLFVLIFKKVLIFCLLLPPLVFGAFFIGAIPPDYIPVAQNIFLAYTGLLVAILAVIIFLGWLQYFRYGIFIEEKALKIQRGLINIEEIGIPYRRIKDVKIQRTLTDQLLGVSDIIITSLGSEATEKEELEDLIALPALEKMVAERIQDALIKKAQVEDINVLGGMK